MGTGTSIIALGQTFPRFSDIQILLENTDILVDLFAIYQIFPHPLAISAPTF